MNRLVRILYVDDYPLDRELVRDALEKEHSGFELVEAASRADFETTLAQGGFDLVLSDFNILGFEGLQVLEAVHAQAPNLPVIIVTGTGSEEVAAEAIKRGAADYVIKTLKHIQRLPHIIHTVLEKKRLEAERQQAEAALRESEQKSRAILDLSFEFVGLLTPDGILLEANRTALEFIGASLADVVGKPFWETPWWSHSPETQNQIREAVMSAAKGEFVRAETTHVAKDGVLHTIDFTLKPIKNESGLITLLIPEGRDITDRKQSEEALKESELKYRTIIERFAEGFALIDEQGYILEWNQAMEQIFGIKHNEAVGQLVWDVPVSYTHLTLPTKRIV